MQSNRIMFYAAHVPFLALVGSEMFLEHFQSLQLIWHIVAGEKASVHFEHNLGHQTASAIYDAFGVQSGLLVLLVNGIPRLQICVARY